MKSEYVKLMEMAGTCAAHVKVEKALFDKVCGQLEALEKFCDTQHENAVYNPIKKCAEELCAKLEKHLDRYK